MKVRHTKNNALKITNMKEELEKLIQRREEFYLNYKRLTEQPMSLELAEKVLAGLEGSGELYSTRAQNKAEEIKGLFVNGKGNKGETRADLLNGVTEYYTHFFSDNADKSFESNEFGAAGKAKSNAWHTLTDEAAFKANEAKGEKMLATV